MHLFHILDDMKYREDLPKGIKWKMQLQSIDMLMFLLAG